MIQNSFKLILRLSNGEIVEELPFSEKFDTIFDAILNASGLSIEFSQEDFAKGSFNYELDEEDVFRYIQSLHGDNELLKKHIKQIQEEKEKAIKQIQEEKEEKEKAIKQLKEENSFLKMQLNAKETLLKKSKNLLIKPTHREDKKPKVFRPKAFVNESFNEAISILSDPHSSEDEKNEAQRFVNAYNKVFFCYSNFNFFINFS